MRAEVLGRRGRWVVALLAAASLGAASVDRRVVEAVKRQADEELRALLVQHADVNGTQPDGATALHWVAYRDDVETAALLLDAGAEADAANDLGATPLSLACENGSAAMVRLLLDAGADANGIAAGGESMLMTAARTGSVEVVDLLLGAGADVNAAELQKQQTALMWSVSRGHTEIARILIDRGADVVARTEGGFTPLLFAAREGRLDAAQLLIASGADVNEESGDGSSVLLVATVRGHTDLALSLLEQGADPNAAGAGYTALHWASGSWETEMTGPNGILTPPEHEWSAMRGVQVDQQRLVEALLAHGADANALLEKNPPRSGYTVFSRRPPGSTPFFLAAMAGEAEIMHTLAFSGADPSIAAQDKTTPLMIAAGVNRNLAESRVSGEESLAAVALAVELGADLNATNDAGDTALHGAARIRSDAIVQLLVDHGAEVNVQNKRGQTPLFIAERYFHPGSPPLVEKTRTGDLLRELSIPEAVQEALRNWDLLPADIRAEVELLLEKALEAEQNPRLNVNPVLPDRFSVPVKERRPLRAATDPPPEEPEP